ILGLPGNPTSALVTARLFLAPLLALLQGGPRDEAHCWESARLATPLAACDGRETFHRARLQGGVATLLAFQDSHAQRVLGQANVLARQAANSPATPAGDVIQLL